MREPSGKAERRHHAHRIIENRYRLHVAWVPDCTLDTCYYCGPERRRILSVPPGSCGCSKRRKGQPKVAGGMCGIGERSRVYHWRKQDKELNQRVAHRHSLDFDSDEVSLLDDPRVLRE